MHKKQGVPGTFYIKCTGIQAESGFQEFTFVLFISSSISVVQIRMGNRDNLGIIFHISP